VSPSCFGGVVQDIDRLFDRGFIGFEDDGKFIISSVTHHPSLRRVTIDTVSAVKVGGSGIMAQTPQAHFCGIRQ
jgi:hypothetical protein